MIAIIIYTSYGDYEKIASGYIAAYSHRHFADAIVLILPIVSIVSILPRLSIV